MPNTHRRRDETVLLRRRRRCEYNSQLAHGDCRRIRSTIWKLTKQTPWRLITPILIDINFFNNDVIMSSLLKKLSVSIFQNSRSQDTETDTDTVCLASFQIVDRIRRQASWASCKFMYTPPTPTRQNSFVTTAKTTSQFRRKKWWTLVHKQKSSRSSY